MWWSCRAATTPRRLAGVGIYERGQAGRGAEGRALAGAQRVAALRRTGAGQRSPASATRWWRSTWAPTLGGELTASNAEVAFVALHGRDGEDGTVQGLLEAVGLPYTGSGPAACMRATDKVLAKHLMREAGHPHARLPRLRGGVHQGAGGRRGAGGASSATSDFPLVVKPASQRLRAGREVRAHERGAAGRDGGRLLLRPQGCAGALRAGARPRGFGPRRGEAPAQAAARGGGGAARGGLLRLRVAL